MVQTWLFMNIEPHPLDFSALNHFPRTDLSTKGPPLKAFFRTCQQKQIGLYQAGNGVARESDAGAAPILPRPCIIG